MSESNETPETQKDAPTGQAPNELPDWARTQISKANQEAANYRVQLRESEAARTSLEEQISTLASEKDSTSSSLSEVQLDFDRLVTAIQAEVPHNKVFAFAKTLQGSTSEELSAHATELKEMFGLTSSPGPAVDRSQGLGADSRNSDPASDFAAFLHQSLTR